MRLSKIVAGKTYGRLTAVAYVKSLSGRCYWRFKCACGTEKEIATKLVLNKSTRSCGCLLKDYRNSLKGKLKTTVIPGRRYFKLKAIKWIKTVNKSAYFLFQCRCGTEKVLRVGNVLAGKTQSCGCLRQHNAYKMGSHYGKLSPRLPKLLEPGLKACRAVWRMCAQTAKARQLEFSLSWEDFRHLSSANCHYCNSAPNKIKEHRGDSYTWNGLDRLDNHGGYTLSNSVPCCWQCNRAKSDSTPAEFIAWAKRVVAHYSFSSKLDCTGTFMPLAVSTSSQPEPLAESPITRHF